MRGSRAIVVMGLLVCPATSPLGAQESGPRVAVRGVYGGYVGGDGATARDYGVNAVWVGSGGLNLERIAALHKDGARVFAEFNTLHDASYLKEHPDAAPVGTDGKPCPPPDGWQGICPTHEGHRRARMDAFRKALSDFPIDGIWLDYHHAHASWEQAVPNLPDTCFCARCLARFEKDTGTELPDAPTEAIAKRLLGPGPMKARWTAWRCGVLTDWVREFKAIRDEVRPQALLGTFHCPWSPTDFDNAIRDKLAIDLAAQAPLFDVLSPMPYHARFGHADDPAWVSRQTAALGALVGVEGKPGERLKIWPIVQLSDWGETVEAEQVREVLDHGTRAPATGVMVFAWGSLAKQPRKVEAMRAFYREIQPREAQR